MQKKRRKQVQHKHGEALTYKGSLKQLRKEEDKWKQKNQQKQKQKRWKKWEITDDENICYTCREEDPPRNDKDSEDGDKVVKWVWCGKCNRCYLLNCVDETQSSQLCDDWKYCCN